VQDADQPAGTDIDRVVEFAQLRQAHRGYSYALERVSRPFQPSPERDQHLAGHALEGSVRHHSCIRLAAEGLKQIEILPRLTQHVRDRRMPDDALAIGNAQRSRV
jgi:hypothetical protein